MKPREENSKGFALVTGLLMLLVLTLLATVVMRGTTLELSMTTAVTRQEQSISFADSGRSLTRELLISSVRTRVEGEVKSGAVGGRPGNVPSFVLNACASPAIKNMVANERFGRVGSGEEITQNGINTLDFNFISLRIQTLNAAIPHINAQKEAKVSCDDGKMGMAVVDISKKIPEGTDASNPEIIKTVALVGFGESFDGGSSKVVSISDVQYNPN